MNLLAFLIAVTIGALVIISGQLTKIIQLLESIDKRLSHSEDWLGQLESEIKRVTRKP
jgi:hypothetical protein